MNWEYIYHAKIGLASKLSKTGVTMKKPKGRIAISVPQLSSDASSLNYQSGRCTQTLLLGSVSSMKCQSGCFSPQTFLLSSFSLLILCGTPCYDASSAPAPLQAEVSGRYWEDCRSWWARDVGIRTGDTAGSSDRRWRTWSMPHTAVNYAEGGVTYNCAQWYECMTTMGWRAAGGCRWWGVVVEKAFELQRLQDLL